MKFGCEVLTVKFDSQNSDVEIFGCDRIDTQVGVNFWGVELRHSWEGGNSH